MSTEPSSSTLYDILQVQPTASIEDIRLAFRELSKRYHPDTTDMPADIALRKFQQLNEAYATLSNAEQRRRYDQQLHRQRRAGTAGTAEVIPVVTVKPRVINNNSAYLDAGDRPLSAGEVFALVILAVTFLACLLLAITLGLSREEPLLRLPSWQQAEPSEIAPGARPNLPEGSSSETVRADPLGKPSWSTPPLEGLTGYHLEPQPASDNANSSPGAIAPPIPAPSIPSPPSGVPIPPISPAIPSLQPEP